MPKDRTTRSPTAERAARVKTNKRQPSPLPGCLLAHLRRWHRIDPDAKHLVEFNRKPIKPVKTGFSHAAELTKLDDVSPHTRRQHGRCRMQQVHGSRQAISARR
jgi:hypothetical protein